MSFLAILASMSFFDRSGTYNLDCFGRVGYKNDAMTTKIWKHMFFMQASDCVINNHNKIIIIFFYPIYNL